MALEKILKNSSGIPTGEYERIAGGTLYADNPIGAIVPFGGTNIPAGFLLCNGAEVLKTDYAELYAVIGDSFGTASVNTKFVLPDLREATTKGVGLTGKSNNHYDSDGVALGEFIDDRVQNLEIKFRGAAGGAGNAYTSTDASATLSTNNMSNTAIGRFGDTTEVKAVGVNYIIKAKQVALPADLEAQVEEAVKGTEGTAETNSLLVHYGTKWIKQGKVVNVMTRFETEETTPNTNQRIMWGFPAPWTDGTGGETQEKTFSTIIIYCTTDGNYYDAHLDYQGEMFTKVKLPANSKFRCCFNYISAEY